MRESGGATAALPESLASHLEARLLYGSPMAEMDTQGAGGHKRSLLPSPRSASRPRPPPPPFGAKPAELLDSGALRYAASGEGYAASSVDAYSDDLLTGSQLRDLIEDDCTPNSETGGPPYAPQAQFSNASTLSEEPLG